MASDDSMGDDCPQLKGMVGVTKVLLDKAEDSDDLKSAGRSLARSAAVVANTVETALLPLVALNAGAAKARVYFSAEDGFKSDIKRATRGVRRVVEPTAAVVGPAMQGLAFAHEEQSLRNMYVGLIAAAMDAERANKAHPAFANIIGQFSANDAKLFRGCIEATFGDGTEELRLEGIPIVSLSCHRPPQADVIPGPSDIVNVWSYKTDGPIAGDWVVTALNNWQRLGLVEITYDRMLAANDAYAWVNKRPEFFDMEAKCPPDWEIEIKKGVLRPSPLGFDFMDAVGSPRDA